MAITRSFWMYCHEDLYRLKRVSLLWDFMREAAERNQALFAGRAGELITDGV
ncbi:lysR family transcriptional regulator [Bordetella holmesii 30539]|uniref:LysR family transcriptional regulator n=1 Tax=Bordetella holmesii 1058 TaxID=1247648 RepID=A0ABP3BGM0_9BORD|nr:lysR family transcriptional regulator [Bordetella holmesii 30539]EXX93040.1 lysR family transcriptional regulator [Bordetella holmesii 1058]